MAHPAPQHRTPQLISPDTGTVRRILITVGLVLVTLLLVAAAVYAAAFLMLAPMMQ
jgi:hypothetical protein